MMRQGTLLTFLLLAVASSPALGDLSAALRARSGNSAPSAPLPMDAPAGSFVVPLVKMSARPGKGTNQAATQGSFYVGRIQVGQPAQELSVLFDTSSGHVLVPHRACRKPACKEHKRYSPWESSTAMDINLDGKLVQEGHRFAKGNVTRQGVSLGYTQSDLGEGDAKSVLVRDHVCLTPGHCADLAVLAATSLDNVPFRAMPNDGIVGLGLESLAAGHLCSFFERLLEGSRAMLPQFGISFGAQNGEIHFGGHDPSRFEGSLHWLPVDHPEQGYWQVAIHSVRVGGVVIDSCPRGCHGVVDTGASRLGVQESNLPKLQSALSAAAPSSSGCKGPILELDLGEFSLQLAPEDYTNEQCAPQLGPLHLDEKHFSGVYALGETVLRRYYAAFNWETKQVGFARAVDADAPKTVIV